MTARIKRGAALLMAAVLPLAFTGCASGGAEPTGTRIGALEVHGVPDIPAALAERLQQYQNVRQAAMQGWLGDGVLIGTRFGDTQQLHRVDRPLGARRQITFSDEPVAAAFLPGTEPTERFVFARDVGGSENFQLFDYHVGTGESHLLTDGRSRYTGVVWANAGDLLAYTTTERNGRDWDIHVRRPDGSARTVLTGDGPGWMVEDWSPDDAELLVSRYVSINESYLYRLSLLSAGEPTLEPLLGGEGVSAIRQARYAPDGGIYFTSDRGAEFLRLHHLDFASGRVRVLTRDVDWDVEAFEVAPDGRHLAFTVNEGGYSRLYIRRLPEQAQVALPAVPRGLISGLFFHPDGERLGFSLARPSAPSDVYSLDLSGRRLTRWTRSEAGGLDGTELTTPEQIEYPTFDEVDGAARQIPAFVYRPQGRGPHPVYVSIHGGPESQYRPRFSPALQYYVNELGMAVIAPNVRGSAGYGKSYLKLDDAELREDSVRDIGALLDWIATQPDLDASRVVVSGGSYGGYMVLASLVHYPDRLAAGVEHVGISNFVTFLTHTEDYRRALRRAEYGDERDPAMREFLERISPLNRVEQIRSPLLIFQGANDPRVPAGESAQIHAALQQREVPVWYVLAHDEGHGFRRKENTDYALAATVAFLERFVLGE